jgi:hypothetical protein
MFILIAKNPLYSIVKHAGAFGIQEEHSFLQVSSDILPGKTTIDTHEHGSCVLGGCGRKIRVRPFLVVGDHSLSVRFIGEEFSASFF